MTIRIKNLHRKVWRKLNQQHILYTWFPRDCSSIGQSTALSRRKLRVRAPSVPMDPNPIKKIHQFISSFPVKERTNNITSFYSKRDLSYFFSTFFIKKKYGNFHFFNEYWLMGESHMCHMWITAIIGSIIFRIRKNTVLGLVDYARFL